MLQIIRIIYVYEGLTNYVWNIPICLKLQNCKFQGNLNISLKHTSLNTRNLCSLNKICNIVDEW